MKRRLIIFAFILSLFSFYGFMAYKYLESYVDHEQKQISSPVPLPNVPTIHKIDIKIPVETRRVQCIVVGEIPLVSAAGVFEGGVSALTFNHNLKDATHPCMYMCEDRRIEWAGSKAQCQRGTLFTVEGR